MLLHVVAIIYSITKFICSAADRHRCHCWFGTIINKAAMTSLM